MCCTNSEVRELPIYGRKEIKEILINEKISYDTIDHNVKDFSFLNQDSLNVDNNTFKNSIYVADFFFTTCPTICPVMTYNMRRVQQKMSNYPNFKILSHSVFPEFDTPNVLLEYANKMQVDLTNWNFVTGKREEIYSIANYYFVNVLEDSTAQGGFLHSEYFILVDKEGRIRARNDDNGNNIGVYDGTDDYQVGLLIDDIKVLMAEYNLAKKDK